MSGGFTRRGFLQSTAASGAFAALTTGVSYRPPLLAASPSGEAGTCSADLEPLVRILEETPRNRLLEVVGARIQAGLTYQTTLAALQMAGVRNVQPRPSVGFKFHAVLVVNSVHLASLCAAPESRWLPIFWALDYFKSAQAQDVREGNWTMGPVDPARIPTGEAASKNFLQAMQQWDESAADAAVSGLARTAGAAEIYEHMFRLGARDFRSIGHKAIFVANSYRTLVCIGWRHAEPVLRSLAYALLMHEGENPANRDAEPDRPWRRNQELIGRIPKGWRNGQLDNGATASLLATLRDSSAEDACDEAVAMLQSGVSPGSIWDAVFLAAAELIVRQPGIVALHALTTSNALHFAYRTSGRDDTRRLLLLQNVAFLPLFRQAMLDRGEVGSFNIAEFRAPGDSPQKPEAAIEQVFADVGGNRRRAADSALDYLDHGGEPQRLIDAARELVFLKGTDSHDYKYSSAVLEDYYHISPAWRNRFLAAILFKLRGTSERDNSIVERTKSALTS